MRDQAAALREMAVAAARVPAIESTPGPSTEVVVLGSGKGGVGKSVLAVLLASALARQDRRVLLLDGSQNQGNLHVLLGLHPEWRLESVLSGQAQPRDLLVPVAERLWLLPADSGAESVHALTAVDRARLHHRLTALYADFDAVVVDSGPGIESVVRVVTMRASRLVVVVVPEPASLSDAYALIKIVHRQVPSLPVHVLVNRAGCEEEALDAFARLNLAAERFLRRTLEYLGAVPEEPGLRRAACRAGGLLDERSATVDALAGRLPAHA